MRKSVSMDRSKIFDPTALKMLFSILAILAATMAPTALAVTALIDFDRKTNLNLKDDLKTCPVPYSPEYCDNTGITVKFCDSAARKSWIPITLESDNQSLLCPLSKPKGQGAESWRWQGFGRELKGFQGV